ncbi:small multi-drug export protein (plasmid) [Haloferacaceae archaeon DSL9]
MDVSSPAALSTLDATALLWLSSDLLAAGSVDSLSSSLFGDIDARARAMIDGASGPWQYVLVFLLAAVPLLEILVVIPIGVALGLNPVFVAAFAFAGNLLPIYGIVLAHDRLRTYLESRRDSDSPSSKRERAERIWQKYGLPGLALLSPVSTGVHLAALIALGLGARGRSTAAWMTGSIALWTVIVTVGSVVGLSLFEAVVTG